VNAAEAVADREAMTLPHRSDPPAGPPRLVCRCIGVSSLRIIEAAQDLGLGSLAEVRRDTGAGTGCGTCHPEIEEILNDLSGIPVSRSQHLANRDLCRKETERRVEMALAGSIVPKLPRDLSVELLWVGGLQVELELRGTHGTDLREWISEKLRKYVCADVEVRFR
jgi:bacterioferritin-associated ferredoxin